MDSIVGQTSDWTYFLDTNVEAQPVTEDMLRTTFSWPDDGRHPYTPPVDIEATKSRVKAMGLEIVEKHDTESLFSILGGVAPAPDPLKQRIRRELGLDDG